MDFKQIQELIEAINRSNISEVTIQDGSFSISIKQAQQTEMQFVAMPAVQQAPLLEQQPRAIQHQLETAGGSNQPAPVPANEEVAKTTIKSPMIGTFYRSAGPDKPAFVNIGDEIKVGQVICIIEAMKLFNEIESEVAGTVVKVIADDASPVEYDQPLFVIQPS
jgi:acetyl-CoA carboxylase biotin carboxyl carrier protein